MQQSILLALLTIAAIVIGPIAALIIQGIIEKRREQRNRKLVIFKELMATRAARISPRYVDALNAVGVEFSESGGAGDKRVLDTWRLYLDHLNTPSSSTVSVEQGERWMDRGGELLIDLLHEMSRSLQYNFDKVALKKNIYAPLGHSQYEMEQRLLRQYALEIMDGKRPIRITEDRPPS